MGLYVLAVFVLCALYVQTRGRVHHAGSRRFTDHSNVMAPINCLFYGFSRVPNTPYIEVKQFPELQPLIENWQVIREEAENLNTAARIKGSDKYDDIGFNSFFRTGWKRFYLTWYGATLKSAEALCPRTVEMIRNIPNVKGAMFAMLPPGARLVIHRDPFAGSLRFHLGLVTPNSEDCFIDVDGEKYYWKDGEAVMFDETFLHFAENRTDINRIILFLDIKRPVSLFLVDWVNELFSRIVMAATATRNMDGDKVGVINKAFSVIYPARAFGKKIKAWNLYVYYGLAYSIYALIIYLLFF
ncbi:MAG TPA: aspartyl/asparaginyl beta-hydroxylase domain-containing protein [Pseudomonadales bacterium]|nr:aspartyl/asparaginyl beta-hydroxylase domain-containing protein [Pseudomonadales bacterium]